jgi:NNP family nitrate/nitrite transporter-like MFS transporter
MDQINEEQGQSIKLWKQVWFWPLIGIVVFQMCNQISNIGWKPLVAPIREALCLNNTQVGMLIGIAGIASLIGALPAGWFAHKFGAKKALVITALFACAGMLLLSAAQNYTQALYGRLVWQFFYRMANIACLSATVLAVPAYFRGRAMGINGAFINMGAMLGAPLGTVVTVAVGWNKAFIGYAGILFIGIIFALLLYKPYQGADRTVVETPKEEDKNDPKDKSVFATPIAWVMVLLMFCFSTVGSITSLISLQLADIFGASIIVAAGIQTFGQGAGILFNPVFGWISDRLGRFQVLMLLSTLFIICYLGMMIPHYYAYLFFAGCIQFIGISASSQVYTAGVYLTQGQSVGAITGITSLGTGIAQFVLPTGLGWLRDISGTWMAGQLVVAALAVAAMLISFYLLKWCQKRDAN